MEIMKYFNPQPHSETPSSFASKPEAHTVYIRGIKDDLLAQITREDSLLLISEQEGSRRDAEIAEGSESISSDEFRLANFFFGKSSICKNKSVSCGQYIKNASKFYLNKYVVDGLYHSKYKNMRMIIGWGIVILLLYWLVYSQGVIGIGNIYRFISPLLLTSILFTFTSGCGLFPTGGNQGEAPWILLASGVNSNTPYIQSDPFLATLCASKLATWRRKEGGTEPLKGEK